MVYFFRRDCDGLTKIGYTANPQSLKSRISQLVTGCPDGRVVYCTTGTKRQESQLHEFLSHVRVGGEWFFDGDSVSSAIALCKLRDGLLANRYMSVECGLQAAVETALHFLEHRNGVGYLRMMQGDPVAQEYGAKTCPDHPGALCQCMKLGNGSALGVCAECGTELMCS